MTVDLLKEVIKKKKENAFRDIDADTLVLWKVGESPLCGLMSSDFREAISTHSFCGNRHEGKTRSKPEGDPRLRQTRRS